MNQNTDYILHQLIQLRKESKQSQRDIASSLHMTQSYLSNIERGKTDVGLSNFIEITRFLGGEVMIIPNALVNAVSSMIETKDKTSKPRWAVEDPDEED